MQQNKYVGFIMITVFFFFYNENVACQINSTNNTMQSDVNDIKNAFKTECVEKHINITEYKLIEEVRSFLDLHISELLGNWTKYDPSHKEYFEPILDGDDVKLRELMAIVYFPYLASFSIAGISFIMFILYIVCTYKQCCCCDKKIVPNEGCHLAYYIVGSILTLGILICSIFGYLLIQDLNPNINSFNCGIIDFFINTKYGEIKESKPKWIGYQNFPNFLNNLSAYYHNINGSVFEQQTWMKEEDKKIKERLNEIENLFSIKEIQEPVFRSTKKIKPDFIRVRLLK